MSSGPDIIYYSAVQWDDFCFLIHSITAYNVQCSAMECKNNTVQCSVRCSRECNVQGSTVQCPVQLFSALYSAIVQCNVQRNAVIRTRVCKCLGEWPLSFGKSSLLLQEMPSASLNTPFFNIKVILKVQRPEQSLAKSSGPEFPWTSSVIYYGVWCRYASADILPNQMSFHTGCACSASFLRLWKYASSMRSPHVICPKDTNIQNQLQN